MDDTIYMHPTTWDYIKGKTEVVNSCSLFVEKHCFLLGHKIILTNYMKPTIYEHWTYPNTFFSKIVRSFFKMVSKITKKNERYYCEKWGVGHKQEFVLGEIWGPSPIAKFLKERFND